MLECLNFRQRVRERGNHFTKVEAQFTTGEQKSLGSDQVVLVTLRVTHTHYSKTSKAQALRKGAGIWIQCWFSDCIMFCFGALRGLSHHEYLRQLITHCLIQQVRTVVFELSCMLAKA